MKKVILVQFKKYIFAGNGCTKQENNEKTISPIISLFIKNVGDKIGRENKSCTPFLLVEINTLSVLSPFIDLFLKIISGCLWPRNEDVVTV